MAPTRTAKRPRNVIAVVDISSSPERPVTTRKLAPFPLASPPLSPTSGPSTSKTPFRRPTRKTRTAAPERIIEVSDSSDSDEQAARERRKARAEDGSDPLFRPTHEHRSTRKLSVKGKGKQRQISTTKATGPQLHASDSLQGKGKGKAGAVQDDSDAEELKGGRRQSQLSTTPAIPGPHQGPSVPPGGDDLLKSKARAGVDDSDGGVPLFTRSARGQRSAPLAASTDEEKERGFWSPLQPHGRSFEDVEEPVFLPTHERPSTSRPLKRGKGKERHMSTTQAIGPQQLASDSLQGKGKARVVQDDLDAEELEGGRRRSQLLTTQAIPGSSVPARGDNLLESKGKARAAQDDSDSEDSFFTRFAGGPRLAPPAASTDEERERKFWSPLQPQGRSFEDVEEPLFLRTHEHPSTPKPTAKDKGKQRYISTTPPPLVYPYDRRFDSSWEALPLDGDQEMQQLTQEPTPPALNPTPPRQSPHLDPAQLEAIVVAADTNNLQSLAQEPEPPIDVASQALAAVLEIIPEVDPDHLLALIEQHRPTYGQPQIVQFILHHLFENPGYPKVVKGKGKEKVEGSGATAGKRKAAEEDAAKKKPKIDYASADRPFAGGADYNELAVAALQTAFPFIPLPFLRKELARKGGHYAPTHLAILEEEKMEGGRRYTKKTVPFSPAKAKGKARAYSDEAFEEEKKWLDARLEGGTQSLDTVTEDHGDEEEAEDDLEDDGTFIECGCCFSTFPFERMAQCPEAHLFCRACMRAYASTQLGNQITVLTCMHTSGCKLPFAYSELARLLPARLLSLYERLRASKAIKDAELEGLEECPFCDWACVMEVSAEEDKLFRCGNEEGGCGEVSCRLCKKKEHVPRTCKEMEEDRHLDGRLAIEEAMTKALMRNCPKCQKAFIKDYGCNKIYCSNCRTTICYVCRQIITGYDHFHQNDPRQAGSSSSNPKCPLWDNLDQRHDQEVKAAYKQALEDYKKEHPDVEVGKDLKVDLPKSPPKPAAGAVPAGYVLPQMLAGVGGAGWGGGGGGGGVAMWAPQPILPPVPQHLNVNVLDREIHQAMAQLQRVLGKRAHLQQRLVVLEDSFRNLRQEADHVRASGGGSRAAQQQRRVTAEETLRSQLTAVSTERAAVEIRLAEAQAEHREREEELAELREEQRLRRAAYDRWRGEQLRRLERERAQAQAAYVEAQVANVEALRRLNQNDALVLARQAALNVVQRQLRPRKQPAKKR